MSPRTAATQSLTVEAASGGLMLGMPRWLRAGLGPPPQSCWHCSGWWCGVQAEVARMAIQRVAPHLVLLVHRHMQA